MFYDDINEDVRNMVQKELEHANSMFPPFHSLHEAYAVIKEEVEEAENDSEIVGYNFINLWEAIKHNDTENVLNHIAYLERNATHLIKEAVQVCAMCQKALDSLSKESTK